MRKTMTSLLKPLAVFTVLSCLFTQAFAMSKLDENLVYNANFGEAAKIRALLDAGANPDAKGDDGWPAISLAAMRPDDEGVKIVHMLVDAGVNLNVRDANGETPLMNAITNNNAPMVKYLIEHGADFRAVNKEGQSVLQFAEHYGSDDVSFLVKEAIRLEDERIREGRSRKHLYRMLDNYIYYNCALEYLAYNKATRLYSADKMEKVERQMALAQSQIGNAQVELQYNFRMSDHGLKEIATNTHQMMIDEMERLISNRNRLKLGVGTDKDLDKRCQKILASWQETFAQYDAQQAELKRQMEEQRLR